MADTRCANPEYQLDVDVMIFEYMLFHAIKAHVDACRMAGAEIEEDGNGDILDAKTDRLLSIFDSFTQIFQKKHPHCHHTEGTSFNIKILQFLVLLREYIFQTNHQSNIQHQDARKSQPDAPLLESRASIFSNSMMTNLGKSLLSKQQARRQWLFRRWYQQHNHYALILQPTREQAQKSAEYALEKAIYTSWTSSPTTELPQPKSPTILKHLLFILLPEFMELSAIVRSTTGEINAKWMKLACELMVQAAINAEQTPKNGVGLADCFAWGYLQESDDEEDEDGNGNGSEDGEDVDVDVVNKMFRTRKVKSENDESDRDLNLEDDENDEEHDKADADEEMADTSTQFATQTQSSPKLISRPKSETKNKKNAPKPRRRRTKYQEIHLWTKTRLKYIQLFHIPELSNSSDSGGDAAENGFINSDGYAHSTQPTLASFASIPVQSQSQPQVQFQSQSQSQAQSCHNSSSQLLSQSQSQINIQEAKGAKAAHLQTLRQQFPAEQFLSSLRSYIEGMWKLSCEEITGGLPVLVRVERGEIKLECLKGLERRFGSGFGFGSGSWSGSGPSEFGFELGILEGPGSEPRAKDNSEAGYDGDRGSDVKMEDD